MSPEDPPTDLLEGKPAIPAIAAVPVTTPGDLVGRTLGKMLLVEKMGRGGAGDVYRAEQVALGRSVVVKVLRREREAHANRIERFLREAKLASKLDHPYAAHIYAFGAEPDGVMWIAMEHVRGATLDELLARRGAMPPAVFAPLFGRLCEVIHTAHELGIVHRDIKGSNVMVIERAGQLLPKLLDFGIAKLDQYAELKPDAETVDEQPELTAHGATLGSPHYMSPEQWASAAEVDARADIYALGALAYRCVAGHLPFRGVDRKQLAEAHRTRPPPALPDAVPAALADVILRALEKQPGDRWASALAFGEAVRFAVGTAAPEAVPIFDPYTRDVWLRAGPQPIADAIARLASAATTVEADAALRELVAISCHWLAVLALAGLDSTLPTPSSSGIRPAVDPRADLRTQLRRVVGTDDALPWLELARAATVTETTLPGLTAALAGADPLAALAKRLDDRERGRTAVLLAADIAAAADALLPLEPLLAYQLVVGRGALAAESWQGPRRRDREPVVVWDQALEDGEVALLDAAGKIVLRLSPLAQVVAPLPSAEPELFLLWRSSRGRARLMAAPWGFERDDDAAGELLAALSTEDSDTAHDDQGDASPYPGLAAYGVDDADRFVGREREIESLANRLVRAPMIAVLGPSGAGKSSFVHAGVLPRLTEAGYRIVTMRPGRHPMHALAALPPVGVDSQDESALASRLRELGEGSPRGLCVVIDQLEELVTLCGDPNQRTKFAETLAAAADGSRAPVRVVVTLRDDFASVLEYEAALRGRFEVFVLGPPSPEALRRIVVEPARRAAVAVDAGVVDDMVAEVVGRPASLPLLSFTAAQLWRTRDKDKRRITREAYTALGGVAGALSTYADQVYDSLARRDQRAVRDLFGRLVASDGTRIPAPRAELEQLPGVAPVLAHLIDARLLVVREDDDTDVVEIVHECLAERWDRLARWRREDAADRALLGDVRAAARRWSEAGRGTDTLWRGESLAELRKLVARSSALTELERAFAEASDAADRRARKLRIGAVALAMASLVTVAIVMAYLGVAANQSAERAKTSAQLAEDRLTESLVSQGRRELGDGRDQPALAYFAEALRRGADSPALRQMIGFADRGRRFERRVIRGATPALASDGQRFAYGDRDGHIHLVAASGTDLADIPTPVGGINGIRVMKDGTLACSGGTGAVIVDPVAGKVVQVVATGTPVFTAQRGPNPGEVSIISPEGYAVYGADGKPLRQLPLQQSASDLDAGIDDTGHFGLFTMNNEIHVVNMLTMENKKLAVDWIAPWSAQSGAARGAFDKGGTYHELDPDGKEHGTFKAPGGHPYGVTYSTDGQLLGLIGDHDLTIVKPDGTVAQTLSLESSESTIAILGPDDVWAGDLDGTVRRYHEGRLIASLPSHQTQVMGVVVAGDAVASVSTDTTLVISDAKAAHLVQAPNPCEHLSSYGPMGPLMNYNCGDKTQLLWGSELVGTLPTGDVAVATVDEASGRVAVAFQNDVIVFDKGKEIARTHPPKLAGAIAFAGPNHMWVLDRESALWSWAIGGDALVGVTGPLTDADTVAGIGEDIAVIGFSGGGIGFYRGKDEIAHLAIAGGRVAQLQPSKDGTWLLATMDGGDAVVIDAQTHTVARKLVAAEALGGTAVFDPTGDFILRVVRGGVTLADRSTGTDLLFNVDLLRSMLGGRALADGRLQLDTDRPALLDIPRDTRPVEEILQAIDCRIPMHVSDSRLEPVEPHCIAKP